MKMSVLDEAVRLLDARISVIPIVLGGDKRPPVAWEPYQSRLATLEEATGWWGGPKPHGIAAVCGAASGNLEVIDFDRDTEALYKEWCALVEDSIPGLLERLVMVRTPRRPAGGMHVWFRCRGFKTPGNAKLAIDPTKPPKERTLIETRGEGGYALVPGGPDGVHENGKPYLYLAESLADVPDITADDREFLVLAARSLGREQPKAETTPKSKPGADLRPGDDYDRRADWGEILRNAGWTEASRRGEEVRWRRPGKDRCWSATTGVCKGQDGADLLRVFSSSCHPLEDGKAYGKFRFTALVDFNGDMAKCAAHLREQNYGSSNGYVPKTKPQAAEQSAEDFAAQFKDRRVATTEDLEKAGAEVEWLWEYWLATKVVCAMAAAAGMGKTRFVADLVRRIRKGLSWPDGQPMTLPPDAKVMWVVADNHHDQMVAIVNDWGIRENVVYNAWANEPYEGTNLESEDDFKLLDLRVKMAKPALVVVDTVGNATDLNLGRQEDARAFYLPLQVMARKRKCCVFCLTHLNTSGQILGKRAKEKVRVVVSLDKPDPADERLALSVSKTFAKPPKPLGVKLTDTGYEYDPDPPAAPPAEPGMEGFGGRGRGRPSAAADAASAWIRTRLAGGPARMATVIEEAEGAGHATTTIFAAIRAVAVQEGEKRSYTLRLKDEADTKGDKRF